jgi:hypothetical protein
LLGAGVALGSAAVGVISDVAKGWFARSSIIRDKKANFTHSTAAELQETLFEWFRSIAACHHADVLAFKQSGSWGRNQVGEELAENERLQKVRSRVLLERLEESALRDDIEALLSVGTDVLIARSKDDAGRALDRLLQHHKEVNQQLGKVLRASWPV